MTPTSPVLELETDRLRLRQWADRDRVPFAEINGDPAVMEHFPDALTAAASGAFVDRIERLWRAQGWGLWAVEIPGVADFAGFVGLMRPTFEASFTPCVEIGWRLAKQHWGHGYAPEAANVVLEAAFGPIGLDEIVSFTAVTNGASQRVMQKLGLHRDPSEDFDHPALPAGHRLRRHVLYRMTATEWREARTAAEPAG